MKLKILEEVCAMNRGFEQARRSLRALARHSRLEPAEVRRFEHMTAETCAAANSYLLEGLGAKATDEAGRLFARRTARERKEEQE